MTEKRVSFAGRDVPVFVEMMSIGAELGRLKPGESLRIHQFGFTTSNGDETISTPYRRQSTEQTLNAVVARLGLKCSIGRDGLDYIIKAL